MEGDGDGAFPTGILNMMRVDAASGALAENITDGSTDNPLKKCDAVHIINANWFY